MSNDAIKLLVAMIRCHVALDLSFLPEAVSADEIKSLSEEGARRFDRVEQWLVRQLASPSELYYPLREKVKVMAADFAEAVEESSAGDSDEG